MKESFVKEVGQPVTETELAAKEKATCSWCGKEIDRAEVNKYDNGMFYCKDCFAEKMKREKYSDPSNRRCCSCYKLLSTETQMVEVSPGVYKCHACDMAGKKQAAQLEALAKGGYATSSSRTDGESKAPEWLLTILAFIVWIVGLIVSIGAANTGYRFEHEIFWPMFGVFIGSGCGLFLFGELFRRLRIVLEELRHRK